MATILISGGTGLVGRALSKKLLQLGHHVMVLTRNAQQRATIDGIQYAQWDIAKNSIDQEAIGSADYIVHLAGAGVVDKPWTGAYKKEILESRTASSAVLVDALKKIPNKVKAVVSASAIGWYGADADPLIRTGGFVETDPADVANFLGSTCAAWEQSIEPVAELGKRLVKLRIGIVLSNDGGAFVEFKKPVKMGVAAVLGNGKQIVSWIHIDDLCGLFVHAVSNESMQGVYNATAPNPCSNQQLTLELARQTKGKFFLRMPVPSFVLKLMMGDRSLEVLKSTTVNSQAAQATGFQCAHKTIDSAIRQLVSGR
jgi:uncharacterized protein